MNNHIFNPALLTILLLAGCTTNPSTVSSTADQAVPAGERLLAELPDHWHRVYQLNTDISRISDFVHKSETAEEWETRISFESLNTEGIDADPIALLIAEAENDKTRCNFVQHFNIHSGYENNYETSVRLFMCGENAFTDSGEIKLAKVIRGNEYLYFVRILHRLAPFKVNRPELSDDIVADWSTYLKKISLCDDTPDHPCPGPAADS